MKKRKLLTLLISICLVLSLAAVPFMTACEEEVTPGEQEEEEEEEEEEEPMTLLIGSLYGMTGWAAGGTTPQGEGSQVCAEWINEQGGITINGQQYLIELVEADTECTAEGSAAGATKLIFDDGVEFIVNTAMAHITVAAGTVTEPAGVLRSVCWNCGSPEELSAATPYTFVAHPSTLNYIKATVAYLAENYPEVETIECMMQDDGSIAGLFPQLQEILAEYGITVTEPIAVAQDIVDYVPITTQALGSNPDALCIVNGWPFIAGSILKAAREQGFEGPVFFTSMCASAEVLEVAGPEASTNFFTGSFSVENLDKVTPMIQDLAARLEAKYGYFTHYHLEGVQTLWCLLQAIEGAQSLDPDVVMAYWDQMDTIETVFGTGQMGGLETLGINHLISAPIAIESLEDGVVVFQGWTDVFIP